MADKLEWMNKHFVLMRYKTVQEAVEKGEISRERYENYKLLYEELKQRKKY